MSAVAMAPPQHRALPSRKPIPTMHPSSGIVEQDSIYTRTAHSHSRSPSSGQNYPVPAHYVPQLQSAAPTTRRTLSNATSSTTSSGNVGHPLNRPPTNSSSASSIRRSTSSRSQQQATSYVALLRRQKATVWCDRAQHEDPRLLAQQRQAKMRATMEVVGGINATSRSAVPASSIGVRQKIRHGNAVKASAFQSGNMAGAGVPMRLSASEVDDGDSDDDKLRGTRYHQRSGSGRSSLSSSHRISMPVIGGGPAPGRLSTTSTPPSRDSDSPSIHDPYSRNPEDTPVPGTYQGTDYFAQPAHSGKPTSTGSGSSDERNFGEMSSLPIKTEDEQRRKTSDELRRRGSVDDRTMNMSSVRLFVANPDLSD